MELCLQFGGYPVKIGSANNWNTCFFIECVCVWGILYRGYYGYIYMVPPPQLSTVFVGSLEPTRENPPYFRV